MQRYLETRLLGREFIVAGLLQKAAWEFYRAFESRRGLRAITEAEWDLVTNQHATLISTAPTDSDSESVDFEGSDDEDDISSLEGEPQEFKKTLQACQYVPYTRPELMR